MSAMSVHQSVTTRAPHAPSCHRHMHRHSRHRIATVCCSIDAAITHDHRNNIHRKGAFQLQLFRRHAMLAKRPSAGRSPNNNDHAVLCLPCNSGCAPHGNPSNPSVKIDILHVSSTAACCPDDDKKSTKKLGGGQWDGWKQRLLQTSNIASILCVIDCTVLPAVTIFLPILGAAGSAEQANWLHDVGQSIALWFVVPVGGCAATMNHLTHRKARLSAMAALGLTLIYAANGQGGPVLSRLPHHLAHSLHSGARLHRATNLLGCAFLLGSNYLSHKVGGCAHNHAGGSWRHGQYK